MVGAIAVSAAAVAYVATKIDGIATASIGVQVTGEHTIPHVLETATQAVYSLADASTMMEAKEIGRSIATSTRATASMLVPYGHANLIGSTVVGTVVQATTSTDLQVMSDTIDTCSIAIQAGIQSSVDAASQIYPMMVNSAIQSQANLSSVAAQTL